MKLEEFRGSPTMWEFKLKGTICHVRAFFQENATKKKKKFMLQPPMHGNLC